MLNDIFQSTHPVRSTTIHALIDMNNDYIFQSTHPVRSTTSLSMSAWFSRIFQSTHPVRGATSTLSAAMTCGVAFQSTHPVRGATAGMDFASQDTGTPTTP